MSKEEKIKSLGFQDEQEMLLYQDVCCDDLPISEPDSLEELYNSLNSDDLHGGYRKEEYEKYIMNHGLVDLCKNQYKNVRKVENKNVQKIYSTFDRFRYI